MGARRRPRKASDDDVTPRNGTSSHGKPPQEDHEFHRSSSSRGLDKDGYVQVELAEIRGKVQCPICQGIIRNTRAVIECLHRFCQECIAKYMLLRSNECPACHAHCASSSLRADPRYDALIEAFYPDVGKSKRIMKHLGQELAFHEEKMTRKNQPETKAQGRDRITAKASMAVFVGRRSQGVESVIGKVREDNPFEKSKEPKASLSKSSPLKPKASKKRKSFKSRRKGKLVQRAMEKKEEEETVEEFEEEEAEGRGEEEKQILVKRRKKVIDAAAENPVDDTDATEENLNVGIDVKTFSAANPSVDIKVNKELTSSLGQKETDPAAIDIISLIPLEASTLGHSAQQAEVTTFSVGDSTMSATNPIQVEDSSATASENTRTLVLTVLALSSACLPSQETTTIVVNQPDASPLKADEELRDLSVAESADLAAADEITEVVKLMNDKDKWKELYWLLRGGYSHITSDSTVKDRVLALIAELSSDDRFKTPELQHECDEFATFLARGIAIFKQNRDSMELSMAVERYYERLGKLVDDKTLILKEHFDSYMLAIDKRTELVEETNRLEALLAEVRHQTELIEIDIKHKQKSMRQQTREVIKAQEDYNQWHAVVDKHLSIRYRCSEDNNRLDKFLLTFRNFLKKSLDQMYFFVMFISSLLCMCCCII